MHAVSAASKYLTGYNERAHMHAVSVASKYLTGYNERAHMHAVSVASKYLTGYNERAHMHAVSAASKYLTGYNERAHMHAKIWWCFYTNFKCCSLDMTLRHIQLELREVAVLLVSGISKLDQFFHASEAR